MFLTKKHSLQPKLHSRDLDFYSLPSFFTYPHLATFQPSLQVSSCSSILAMDSVMALGTAKPVVIFSKSNCCMSHSIQTLISSYGASPTVYELDEIPNGQQMEKALPGLGCPNLPAVFIGKKLVGGAREVMSLQVRGELADLLIEAKAIFFWNKK